VVSPELSPASGLGYQLVLRLTGVEAKLDALMAVLGSKDEAEWIDRKTACSLLNVSDRHLYDLIAKGVIRADSFRNVGTVKKPRYRFHRAKLLNQYHRRA
jgi:excisionase family DNA binding protein